MTARHRHSPIERKVALRIAQDKWDELAAQAKQNYRTINAEIAIRVLESLPREGE